MPSLLAPLRKAARMADAKIHSPDGGVAPLDAIFACSVCGDTLTDVYSGPRETVQGLSDGINTKDRLVTRLYVSSCCHVICDKHIEGGNGTSVLLSKMPALILPLRRAILPSRRCAPTSCMPCLR